MSTFQFPILNSPRYSSFLREAYEQALEEANYHEILDKFEQDDLDSREAQDLMDALSAADYSKFREDIRMEEEAGAVLRALEESNYSSIVDKVEQDDLDSREAHDLLDAFSASTYTKIWEDRVLCR
jgi:hypothetical protein